MTDREIIRYINNLLKKRKISLETVAEYYSTNKENFKSPELFFSQNDINDYPKFYAIANLLSDNSEEVMSYFKQELKEKNISTNIYPPVDEDYLYILTAFVYYPVYFALAWNWTSFIESRISIKKINSKEDREDSIINSSRPLFRPNFESICEPYIEYAFAASESGFRQSGTEHSLGKYGKIWKKTCNDVGMQGVIFFISLSCEYQTKKVSFEITFETLADNKEYKVSVSKSEEKMKEIIQSKTIKADISKGIKVNKVVVLD